MKANHKAGHEGAMAFKELAESNGHFEGNLKNLTVAIISRFREIDTACPYHPDSADAAAWLSGWTGSALGYLCGFVESHLEFQNEQN